jgi:hypothetical protein
MRAHLDEKIIEALRTFNLDEHHELIYDDVNVLIDAGFPASFIFPLIQIFQSSSGYFFHWRGKVVNELIGIRHSSLVYAIAHQLSVPANTGSITGRGFAMRADRCNPCRTCASCKGQR